MKLPDNITIVSRTHSLRDGTKQGIVTVYASGLPVLVKEWKSTAHLDLIKQEVSRILNRSVNLGLRLVA